MSRKKNNSACCENGWTNYFLLEIIHPLLLICNYTLHSQLALTRPLSQPHHGASENAPVRREKTWAQSLNFSVLRLETIYQKLLDADIAIKTGRNKPMLALDLLVVELMR
jgi:DNA polymerase III delta subunit